MGESNRSRGGADRSSGRPRSESEPSGNRGGKLVRGVHPAVELTDKRFASRFPSAFSFPPFSFPGFVPIEQPSSSRFHSLPGFIPPRPGFIPNKRERLAGPSVRSRLCHAHVLARFDPALSATCRVTRACAATTSQPVHQPAAPPS